MADSREWRLEGGQYLGEISALCFLPLPPHFSSLPYLLAGTGSQILVFDLSSGTLLKSFNMFEGIRVHGISCGAVESEGDSPYFPATTKMVVYGERRVKLFALRIERVSRSENQFDVVFDMTLLQLLPRFSQWVLDVSFLEVEKASSGSGCQCLAVGCSDNSVHIWNILASSSMLHVRCSEKCLLYSMRLWGDRFEALRVACGTIFNEIVVWKVIHQDSTKCITSTAQESDSGSQFDSVHTLNSQIYVTNVIRRLLGHQGSIFRISWSTDGSKLVSVSDDRSARVWTIDPETNGDVDTKIIDSNFSSSLVLYGHNARVWDCSIFDSLIVTAGEDCTSRLWGSDGSELKIVKEHIGRGIWRCLYDPQNSLLVTAGFDSAIKVRQFCASSDHVDCDNNVNEGSKQILKLCLPNSAEYTGLTDSKSEYVRCLQFASGDQLYVATNRGFVYHLQLSESEDVKWNKLVHVGSGVQIICMDLLINSTSMQSNDIEHWVAVGDGKGGMTVLKITSKDCSPRVDLLVNWPAELERQLLRVYWCKALGNGYLFTADPRGNLKLWRLVGHLETPSQHCMSNRSACLVAEFKSSFGARIMCLDASIEEKVLVCGDLRGNLMLFPLSVSTLLTSSPDLVQKIPPLTSFKGAHGISAVSSISLAIFNSQLIEIHSTGGDGCICYLEYDEGQQILDFVGMKQVKDLSLVESVHTSSSPLDSADNSYAVGFSSADFVVRNLLTEAKVVQVACGGWRRPHSFYLGCIPERNNCFAYVKDEIIYILRHSVEEANQNILPQNFHLQFHGREIHCLRFISAGSLLLQNSTSNSDSNSSWIVTGCEDGTVRLTRYAPGTENWSTSKLLGEHVGGSAVRSLYFISSAHLLGSHLTGPNGTSPPNDALEDKEHPCLLISVGAKRVLTSWLLRTRESNETTTSASEDSSSISFKWLSTDMPTRIAHNHKKVEGSHKVSEVIGETTMACDAVTYDSEKIGVEMNFPGDLDENDWRFMAVTAFLVKIAYSRLTICFVVVAASDATLTLRAMVLPHRYWFDVASLVPLSSPALTLQHVVAPLHPENLCVELQKVGISQGLSLASLDLGLVGHNLLVSLDRGDLQSKNAYIVISGCTDGSIAFWDLTAAVEAFVQKLSSLNLENTVDFQKRPRTGRGSQGGRRRRSISALVLKKASDGGSTTLNGQAESEDNSLVNAESHDATSAHAPLKPEDSENSAPKMREVFPLCVVNRVHQSGVNCLHVSEDQGGGRCHRGRQYDIVSGGDDQALTLVRFSLAPSGSTGSGVDHSTRTVNMVTDFKSLRSSELYCQNQGVVMSFLWQSRVASAHSSAVKGIWTDSTWVFSTGLDQRVRCWRVRDHGELTEHSRLIVSVPEPEDLDARATGGYFLDTDSSISDTLLGLVWFGFRNQNEINRNEMEMLFLLISFRFLILSRFLNLNQSAP